MAPSGADDELSQGHRGPPPPAIAPTRVLSILSKLKRWLEKPSSVKTYISRRLNDGRRSAQGFVREEKPQQTAPSRKLFEVDICILRPNFPDGRHAVPLGGFIDTGATHSVIWESLLGPDDLSWCNINHDQTTEIKVATGDVCMSIGTVNFEWLVQGNPKNATKPVSMFLRILWTIP